MSRRPRRTLSAGQGDHDSTLQGAVCRVKPRRQGQLDSLCGIYAIINAFAHAAREQPLRYFPTKRLFMHLIEVAARRRGDTSFIGNGLDHAELKHLCKKAILFHRKQGYEFKLIAPKSLLPNKPYPRDPTDVQGRLAWFSRASELSGVGLIVDINTDWISHWSVLGGITSDRLCLYDSNAMKTVAAAACEPCLAIQVNSV